MNATIEEVRSKLIDFRVTCEELIDMVRDVEEDEEVWYNVDDLLNYMLEKIEDLEDYYDGKS